MGKYTLEFADDAVEGQACPLTLGSVGRRVVGNRWAAVTRMAWWWCQTEPGAAFEVVEAPKATLSSR